MKNSTVDSDTFDRGEVIALFGNARLVRWKNGTFQIQGGTGEDRKNAAEWAARFVNVRFAKREIIGI